MTLLENSEFLDQLGKFFLNSRIGDPKSVSITMKRYDGKTKPLPRDPKKAEKPQPPSCLFRVRLGSKKISTVVPSKEVNKFHSSYSAILRSNMDNLEKRPKKTDEDKKAKKPKKTSKPQTTESSKVKATPDSQKK